MLPLKNIYVTCKYGWRIHPVLKERRFHHGVDLRAPMRTEIYAIADGTVIFAGNNGGYGKTVKIDHGNGIVSLYGHCSWLNVRKGDKVTQGRVIALSGNTGMSTGPHLHFGIYVNGGSIDPLEHKLVKGDGKLEEITIRKEGKTYKGFLIGGIAYGAVRELFVSQGQEVVWRDSEREAVVTAGPLEKLRDIKNIVKEVE
jgi:hypothetical protein